MPAPIPGGPCVRPVFLSRELAHPVADPAGLAAGLNIRATKDDMDIAVLRTFLCILDEGSFAGAARRMGISKSLSSKHIADLEADLGTRLLVRTTRAVTPTTLGLAYAEKIREALRLLDSANESLRCATGHPSGPLKIGSPIFYTLKILQPHILRFMEQFPDIQLEIVLDDGTADLIGDGFDAVIRIGQLGDSTLLARKLHEVGVHMVATPDYLAENGVPLRPADLTAHKCLHYTNLRGAGTWPLRRDGEVIYQKIQPAFSTNNSDMLRSLAVNGKGIALLPDFVVEDDIASGLLVPVMGDFALPDIPVSLVYPSRKLMTAAMRNFVDFLTGLKLD